MSHQIEPVEFKDVANAGVFVSSICSHAKLGFWRRLVIETEIKQEGPDSTYVVSTKYKSVVCRTRDINKAIYAYNNCEQ